MIHRHTYCSIAYAGAQERSIRSLLKELAGLQTRDTAEYGQMSTRERVDFGIIFMGFGVQAGAWVLLPLPTNPCISVLCAAQPLLLSFHPSTSPHTVTLRMFPGSSVLHYCSQAFWPRRLFRRSLIGCSPGIWVAPSRRSFLYFQPPGFR